jgi:iron(III) transport system substrate-binding protein
MSHRLGAGPAIALAIALTLTAAACGGGGSSSGEPTLTLYSGQHEQTTAQLVSAFEAATGIKVKIRTDDEAVLANQVAQEGSNSPADVFYSENTPPLEFLQEKHLLSPLAPATLAAVSSEYSSTAGDWVGVSARVDVMVYNTGKVQAADLPHSVMDLASPAWKGKLGIAPSETDFQPIIESVIRTYGTSRAQQWLQGVKSNAGGHIYPDNESLVNVINRGQVELGLMNHYYWYRERDEVGASHMHSAIAFFAPRDAGYVIDVSGAAVLKSSNHQAEAQRLVAFLVSHAGEEVIAHSESYEYPLGSKVETAKPLPAFAKLQPTAVNLAQLGDGSQALQLLQQVQLL